jgi:hypothetical protein
VAAPVTHFISLKVVYLIEVPGGIRFLANLRRAFVPMVRMETVVYVALKVGSAMKPRASADEDTAHKPFGP